MPPAVRLYVKTAFVHLGIGLGLWGWKGLDPIYRPAVLHLFFVGWLLFLIIGVAHWMFPRYSRERVRGREGWVVAAYPLLLIGLWLRVFGEPLVMAGEIRTGIRWGLAAGGWLQFLGVVLVTGALWPRIRALGRGKT